MEIIRKLSLPFTSLLVCFVLSMVLVGPAQAADSRSHHAAPLDLAVQNVLSYSAASIQGGALLLTRCKSARAYCGVLDRPLDPAGEVQGTIGIGFEFYPRADRSRPTLGTIVATEGGPRYATTGSRPRNPGLFDTLRDSR